MSDSYPFLALARASGEDYGTVLSYADLLGTSPSVTPTYWQRNAMWTLPLDVKENVKAAIFAEEFRRRSVK